MSRMFLVYGNQPLELEEEVSKLIATLLPAEDHGNAVFQFNAEELFQMIGERRNWFWKSFRTRVKRFLFFANHCGSS